MGKKQRILLAGLLVAALGGFAWLALSQPREPFYQGKPLSYWLKKNFSPDLYSWSAGIVPVGQPDDAILNIGTNAIPFVLRNLRKTDSPLKYKLLVWAGRQKFITFDVGSAYERNFEAARALEALGPAASNAVPALIEMFDQSVARQGEIADIFRCIGPAAGRAVPSLLRVLTGTNVNVYTRDSAAFALASIGAEPGQAVPVLIEALNGPSWWVRENAAQGLAKFGTNGLPAVPALLALYLKDKHRAEPTNSSVIFESNALTAELALKAIDPEAAAKAGVK